MESRNSRLVVEFWLGCAADGAETLLELIDTTFGVNEGGFTSEEWVSVSGDAHGDDVVFNAVNSFFVGRFGSGACEVTLAGGHVLEDDRIVFWMDISFHMGAKLVPRFRRGGSGRMQMDAVVSRRIFESFLGNLISASGN